MSDSEYALRKTAIHLLRRGKSPAEVAQELNRSLIWVYKWRKRFFREQDWQALQGLFRTSHHQPRILPAEVRSAIRTTHSQLEAEVLEPGILFYIDTYAIRARLRKNQVVPLPCVTSIERELRAAHLTKFRRPHDGISVVYPHLHNKHSEEAVAFLLYVWQEIGLSEFTQVDNEGCFSGGFTHSGVHWTSSEWMPILDGPHGLELA